MKLTGNKKAPNFGRWGALMKSTTKRKVNMTTLALSFNEVNFSPIERDGQIWLTASELAKALGYAKSDAVNQIYERNKDEFNSEMTTTLKLSVVRKTGSVEMDNRIFNSRGCHLITFFARTAVAKQFRKWVLDVLDKHIGAPVSKTHKSERTALHEAHALLVTKTKHLNASQAWKLIHQRFNVNDVADIPYDAIPVAVEYVHHLIALYSIPNKQEGLFDHEQYELIRKLTEAIMIQNDEIVPALMAVKMIDIKKYSYFARLVVSTNETAKDIARSMDFRNKLNEPLIDENCVVVALSSGVKFPVRPNWFNYPG